MPPQRILPPQHKMPLILKPQELTLDPPHLTDVKRRQALRDRAAVVQIAMDDQHRRAPLLRMLRRIERVPMPLPPRGRERAAHIFGKAGDDVRGEHAVGGEDAVVADERFQLLG